MTGETLAIRARGLGKRYRKGADTHGRLIHWFRYRGNAEHIWALRDVDLDVRQGEMLGVIGANGAGKSTLLKVLSRITRPNAGEVTIRGRVGSLLEVGTGFHPELTGRENVFLNGALIGMPRREVRARFDEIVDFSGVGPFLDTPLKRYSSGMQVRLGFAVAVNLRQEIMLVDEVLSVGDAAYREKCLLKMDEITGHGRTVLFVGHNLEMVRANCHRVIWLDAGRVRATGSPEEIVGSYEDSVGARAAADDGFLSLRDAADHRASRGILLTHVRLLDGNGRPRGSLVTGKPATLAVGYAVTTPPARDVSISLVLSSAGQVTITTCDSAAGGVRFDDLEGEGELRCAIETLPLVPGRYRLGVRCRVGNIVAHSVPQAGELFVVEPEETEEPPLPRGGGPLVLRHAWTRADVARGSTA